MPIVRMPDGALVDMPENPTPEQLAKLKAVQEGSGGLKHKAGLAVSALGRGIAALPGLAVDFFAPQGAADAELASAAAGRAPDPKMQSIMQGNLPMGATKAIQSTGVQPQGKGEEYADAILQAVGGSLTPGMGLATTAAAPVRTTIAAGSGGAGGKLASDLFPGNPIAPVLGGMTAGGLAAGAANFAGGVRPQVKRVAAEATEGLSPEQLAKAQAMMAMAKSEGVDIDLVQALDMAGQPTGNLETIRNILAQHSAGNKVQSTLRGQPAQYNAKQQLTQLALPGEVKPDTEVANAVQQAATSAVDLAKKQRTAAVQPHYKAAGELRPEARKAFKDTLYEPLNQPGTTSSVANAIRDAAVKLEVNPATAAKTTHALDYDTIISDMMGPFRGTPLSPSDPRSAGQMKNLGKQLNETLKGASPEIKAGEELYAQISKTRVDPLKQSVVGQLATKKGYLPDTQASVARLESVFSKGSNPDSAGRSDILTLARELNKVDKDAFPNAAKTFISDRLTKAFEPELGGVPGNSSEAAKKVWDSLFADKRKWQGMRDMAAGMADAHGMPREDVVRGLETFALITKGLKNRPGQIGGLDPKEVKELGGANRLSNIARVYGFLPFERIARKIEDKQLANTFAHFDDLMTSPDGAQLLAKLGKRSVMDQETLVMLAGFRSGVSAGVAESPGNIPE